MASPLLPRSSWVDPRYPVTGPPADLDAIDAIAVHYPGVLAPASLALSDPVVVLRATQLYYETARDYSIGYNFATFPSGRYECRGFGIKNAANKGHNDHTLSINVMVNDADEATASQVEHTQAMVADIFTVLDREVPLIAHGDLPGAATACPGAGIRRQLEAGLFLPAKPPPPSEVEMTEPMHLIGPTGEALWTSNDKFVAFMSPEDAQSIITAQKVGLRVAISQEQMNYMQSIGI